MYTYEYIAVTIAIMHILIAQFTYHIGRKENFLIMWIKSIQHGPDNIIIHSVCTPVFMMMAQIATISALLVDMH